MKLYDSTNAAAIPADAAAVAGYGNGTYAWSPADWQRWAHVPTLMIDVKNENIGQVLDVERGDAVPADAPAWAARARERGVMVPLIYCSRAAWQSVIDAFIHDGVAQGGYWIADWTDEPHQTEPPASLVQYTNPPLSGGHYDISIVEDESVLVPASAAPITAPPGTYTWIIDWIPAGVPVPALPGLVKHTTVVASDAQQAIAQAPQGSTFVGVHGPY